MPPVVKRKGPLLALLVCTAWASLAHAHEEFSPQLVNRYLNVIVLDDRAELFLALLYGNLPAVDERKRMDGDGDGRLSAAELDAAGQAWARAAGDWLSVSLDGRPVPAVGARAEVDVGGDDSIGAAPLVVELNVSVPLDGRAHRLRVEPRRDPPRAGETETTLELPPGWQLVESAGRGRVAGEPRFKLQGPRVSGSEDRAATFVIHRTTASAAPVRTSLVLAVAAVALLALGLAALLLWWRRGGLQRVQPNR